MGENKEQGRGQRAWDGTRNKDGSREHRGEHGTRK
jgi:hypothetical protein